MAENPRIEELRRRVQADPASIAFAALAEEFRRVGRYDEAVDACRTGLQRHPAYLSARVTLGRALIETGDFEAAREELETVLRSAPENLAAIRGLAQIHERLGQSSEMDPHLADMMKTMHAESIRVAAQPPPEPEPAPAISEPPPQAPAPEPVLSHSLMPQLLDDAPFDDAQGRRGRPDPAPELEISMAPEPDAGIAPPADPFAGFALMSTPAPAADFSFDPAATPSIDLPMAPAAEPVVDPVYEPVFEAPPIASPEPHFEPEAELEPEPESEPALPALTFVEGPDPEVLATLARLERFLGAIQSLRA
jgi:tetratricopeptide (TPR) repeat protein